MYLFQYIDELNDYENKEVKEEINNLNIELHKFSPLDLLIYWFIHADENDDTFDYVKNT